jgi:DNA-binding transcriptional regulator YdaS (Cro superfamily)
MKKTSLRQLARQLGVSPSYLSQVKNGKRPPSQKLLSNADIRHMLTVKQNVKREVDVNTSKSYNLNTWQRSSGVEQRTHNPKLDVPKSFFTCKIEPLCQSLEPCFVRSVPTGNNQSQTF